MDGGKSGNDKPEDSEAIIAFKDFECERAETSSACRYPVKQFSLTGSGRGSGVLMDGNPITDEEVVRLLNQAEELKNSVQDVADFDLGFALCHIDHAGTRRGVKKSQEKLRSLLGYNVLGCNATD